MKLHWWFPETRPWLSRVGVFFNLLYHYTDGKQLAMFYREQDQREGSLIRIQGSEPNPEHLPVHRADQEMDPKRLHQWQQLSKEPGAGNPLSVHLGIRSSRDVYCGQVWAPMAVQLNVFEKCLRWKGQGCNSRRNSCGQAEAGTCAYFLQKWRACWVLFTEMLWGTSQQKNGHWWGEVAKLPFFHAHSCVMMVVSEGKAKATALLL